MADDGGGNLASESEIIDNISLSFEDMGTVFTSAGSIPVTATVRAAGSFTEAHSAMEYLESGGLIATEGSGSDVIPIGFVYFLEEFDEILQENLFTIYIDEDTN